MMLYSALDRGVAVTFSATRKKYPRLTQFKINVIKMGNTSAVSTKAWPASQLEIHDLRIASCHPKRDNYYSSVVLLATPL